MANHKPTGKRGAAYIRVSHGEKQNPERQREAIRSWAEKAGVSINDWYEDIDGRNPRDLAERREQFQRMLADVKAGKWDWIVVDSQDRFGVKDQYEYGYFVHILRQHDCELWSVAQGLLSSTDDAAVFVTTVGNVTSSKEQKEKARRTIGGKRVLAAQGEWQGGYIPYGFDVACIDRATQTERFRVVVLKMIPTQNVWQRMIVYPDKTEERCDGENRFPNKQDWERFVLAPSCVEERVKTVQDIFRLFATGAWTIRGLCKWLNDQRVEPVTGIGWYHTRLKPLLSNPAYYVGNTVWGKNSHGRHGQYIGGEIKEPPRKRGRATAGRKNETSDWVFPPPGTALIEKAVWNEVQTRLAGIKGSKRGLRDERLWLAGLVYCSRCGQRMSGWKCDGELTYCCNTYRKYGKSNPSGCRLHRVKQEAVEAVIVRYFDEVKPALRSALDAQHSPPSFTDEAVAKMNAAEDEFYRNLDELFRRLAEWMGGNLSDVDDYPWSDALWLYRQYWERNKAKNEADLATATAELTRRVETMNTLPPESRAARDIQRRLIAEADARVQQLQVVLEPLDEKILQANSAVYEWDWLIDSAKEKMAGTNARQKAAAVGRVISRIVLHFRHYEHRTSDSRAKSGTLEKSALQTVEIVPHHGEPTSYGTQSSAAVSPPGPD